MLFENHKCNICQSEYDTTLRYCPKCGNENLLRPEKAQKSPYLWLPPIRQIVLFLIGLGGINIFELLLGLAFYSFYSKDNPAMYNALTVYVSYGLTFIGLFITLIPMWKNIRYSFSKIKPYLFGLLFGGGLIIFSILYGLFINKCYPTSTSDNEQIAQRLAIAYPFSSILILCFVGPIVEEITYRISLFTFLNRFNKILAYIITCLVFALIHFNFTSSDLIKELIYLPNYLVAGFLLTLSYDLFGPACSFSAHIVNNLYSVIGVIIINAIK